MTAGTAMVRGPQSQQGLVEYKPSAMQQRVMDLLTKPESMAVLAPLVPKDVDREAVAIEVYRAVTKNPAILKCTESSIIMAVADCISTGLIIGKTIHLVPVSPERGAQSELQAWTDYKGDIELVVGSGAARLVYANPVFENDHFAPQLGDNPRVDHVPAWKEPPGKMVAVYAVAFITNTIKKVTVMRLDQVEKIRAKSKQWNPNKFKECPDWYACKTAIHRLCKDLPKNPKLAKILARFEREDIEDHGAPIASGGESFTFAPPEEVLTAEIEHEAIEHEATEPQPSATATSASETPAPAASTVAAPAPATAPQSTELVRDLAWAKAFTYPMKRSEFYGKPIAEFSYEQLQSIEQSILKARKDKNDDTVHAELLASVRIVMDALEEPQPTLALEDDEDLLAPTAAGSAAATQENPTTLRPGKIEDALDKPATVTPKPAPAPTSLVSLADASREVANLLKDPKLSAAERADYKGLFDKANTAEAMQKLAGDLRDLLQQPF
jgi:recombination protein RecT